MKTLRLLTAALCASLSFAANATLIGDTVHIAQNYPVIGNEHFPTNAVVGGGVEFNWPNVYSVNVGASSIDILFGNVSFVDIPAGGNNHNGPIIGGLNDSSGNPLFGYGGFLTNSMFAAANIIFGNDYIGFNLDGMNFQAGQSIHVDLDFGQAVPEPGTLALLGLGLFGIAARMRRRG